MIPQLIVTCFRMEGEARIISLISICLPAPQASEKATIISTKVIIVALEINFYLRSSANVINN